MGPPQFLFVIAFLSLLSFGLSQTCTWYVSSEGTDNSTCVKMEGDCLTVGFAIDATGTVKNCSLLQVFIRPGVYSGNNNVDIFVQNPAKIPLVISALSVTSPPNVILDAKSQSRHMTVSGADITVRGLQFQNGNGSSVHLFAGPGALYVDENSFRVYLESCLFFNNTASDDGGALAWFIDGVGNITNCIFRNNYAPQFGGGALLGNVGQTIVDGCVFEGNTAGIDGGGASVLNGIRVLNSVFQNNVAGNYGGGAYIVQLNELWKNVIVSGNKAVSGGGIYEYSSNGAYSNCAFMNNTATEYGGGLSLHVSNSIFTNCSIVSNSAKWGGGFNTYMEMSRNSGISTKLRNSVVVFNWASYLGGGVYCNDTAIDSFVVNSNNISFNKAHASKDLFCTSTCLTVQGSCACGEGDCGGYHPSTAPLPTPSEPGNNNVGGKVAAGILVPLIVIGLAVGGYYYWKKRSHHRYEQL